MSQKGFFWIPVLIAVIIVLILGAIFYFAHPTHLTAPSVKQTPLGTPINLGQNNFETVAVDSQTQKYVNHTYGFSITFPKLNKAPINCKQWQESKTGTAPLKVFDVPDSNILYISQDKFIEWQDKEATAGAYQSDPTTCQLVTNNLDLIQNGYLDGEKSPMNKRYPDSFQVNYAKISSDEDLSKFAETIYKDCTVGDKKLQAGSQDIYTVSLTGTDGKSGPGSKCFVNFKYIFLYSTKTGTAVITSGFQSPPFNGTNNQDEPEINFL